MVWEFLRDNDRPLKGIAIYNYDQSNISNHLNILIGDNLRLIKFCGDWLYGYKWNSPHIKGVFPKSHVHIIEEELELFPGISEHIWDWKTAIHKCFINGDEPTFASIEKIISIIAKYKARTLNHRPTADEAGELLKEIQILVAQGSKHLNLPLLVFNKENQPINLLSSSVDVFRDHLRAVDIVKTSFNPKIDSSGNQLIYIDLKLKSVAIMAGQCSEIDVTLFLVKYVPSATNAFIRLSENHKIRLQSMDKFHFDCYNANIIFADLQELSSDERIYLILHLSRVGGLRLQRKQSVGEFQKPFSVACYDLTDNCKSRSDLFDFSIPLHLSNEESFDSVMSRIITTKQVNPSNSNFEISWLKILSADTLKIIDNKHGRRSIIVRRYGLPSDMNPSVYRNELYITLESAEFKKDQTIQVKADDVEVEVSLHDTFGHQVEIYGESSLPHKSTVYHNTDKPKWMELIKLDLSSDLQPNKLFHLRFLIKHLVKDEKYSVAYLNLFPNPNLMHFLSDGKYELIIHKMTWKDIEKSHYLNEPCFQYEIENSHATKSEGIFHKFTSSNPYRGVLNIESRLCSTTFTSNSTIFKILRWKQYPDELVDLLSNKFVYNDIVPDLEIKIFAEQLLDAILKIQSEALQDVTLKREQITELGHAGISALIRCFKTLLACPSYNDLVLNYLENKLHLNNLHNHILSLLVDELRQETVDIERVKKLDWFIKIIVKSKLLSKDTLSSQFEILGLSELDEFYNNMKNLLEAICDQAKPTQRSRVLLMTIFKHIGSIINDLALVFDLNILTQYFKTLLELCDSCEAAPKENLLQSIIDSKLFDDIACRKELVDIVTVNLLTNFRLNVDKALSQKTVENSSILERWCDIMLSFFQRNVRLWETQKRDGVDVTEEVTTLLIKCDYFRSIVQTLIRCRITLGQENNKKTGSMDIIVSSLGSIVLSILQHLPSGFWNLYMTPCYETSPRSSLSSNIANSLRDSGVEPPEESCRCNVCIGLALVPQQDILRELLSLLHSFCVSPVFPSHGEDRSQPWMDMLYLQSKILLTTLRDLFQEVITPCFMDRNFTNHGCVTCSLPPNESEWARPTIILFRECLEAFIIQKHLKIESLSSTLQHRYIKNFPDDLRWKACQLFEELWNGLGDNYKIFFIRDFVKPLFNISSVPLSDIRCTTVRILFDMMHISVPHTEYEAISAMDQLVHVIDRNFVNDMEILMKEAAGNSRRTMLVVNNIMKQMSLLLEFSCFLDDDSKMNAMLAINNLRNFYHTLNRNDLYMRYLYKLVDLHHECRNITEKGFTLHFISTHLTWEEQSFNSYVPLQYQHLITQRELKEKLLLDTVECFDEYDWEKANEVYCELVEFYRTISPNYEKLSQILKRQSETYNRIAQNKPRPRYTYFLIRYYGSDYPSFITDRPSDSHRARILEESVTPEEGDTCFSFIYRCNGGLHDVMQMVVHQFPEAQPVAKSVTAISGNTKKIFTSGVVPRIMLPNHLQGKKLDRSIEQYFEKNEVREFEFARNLNRTEDVTEMRMEVSEFSVMTTLPNILPLLPIRKIVIRNLGPIEVAIKSLNRTHKELKTVYEDFISSNREDAKQISGNLRGMVDAPVQGGLTKYLKLVEDVDDSTRNELVDELTDTVRELLHLLFVCFKSWEAGPAEVQLRTHLVNTFKDLATQLSVGFGFSVADLNFLDLESSQKNRVFTKENATVSAAHSNLSQAARSISFTSKLGAPNIESVQTMVQSYRRLGYRPSMDIQRNNDAFPKFNKPRGTSDPNVENTLMDTLSPLKEQGPSVDNAAVPPPLPGRRKSVASPKQQS